MPIKAMLAFFLICYLLVALLPSHYSFYYQGAAIAAVILAGVYWGNHFIIFTLGLMAQVSGCTIYVNIKEFIDAVDVTVYLQCTR